MTGYMGRSGIYEIMLMSPAQKKLVAAASDIALIREQAYKEGMRPLRISGAQKVAAGMTTMDEVLRVTPPPGQ
jgi:general secretion pathway protein E